jgi:hypothetical protein
VLLCANEPGVLYGDDLSDFLLRILVD